VTCTAGTPYFFEKTKRPAMQAGELNPKKYDIGKKYIFSLKIQVGFT
jgi:hypothetical protein